MLLICLYKLPYLTFSHARAPPRRSVLCTGLITCTFEWHRYAFLNQQVFRKVTRTTHWARQGLTGPCQIKATLIPSTQARIHVVIINANPEQGPGILVR